MKRSFIFTALLCAALPVLAFTSCGDDYSIEDKTVIGSWRNEQIEYISEITYDENCNFTEVVSSKTYGKLGTVSGKYYVKNGRIHMDFNKEERLPYDYRVDFSDDGKTMTWHAPLNDVIYERQ